MGSHPAAHLPATEITVSLPPAAPAASARLETRITSSTRRLLGFVVFWAALAVWSVWLLAVTGVVAWNPDGISVDLPWYGWVVLLAWTTWLVGANDHHRPRSQAAQSRPTDELAVPRAS